MFCGWIGRRGGVYGYDTRAHDHYEIACQHGLGDTKPHMDVYFACFEKGIVRVRDTGNEVVAQWAGKLTAQQRSKIKEMIGEHHARFVYAGANDGTDPEDSGEGKTIDLQDSRNKRRVNKALMTEHDPFDDTLWF